MHVGMSAFFQNLGEAHTDQQVYAHELAMADRAEPLGFDSIWAAEHHFTHYTMCPNTMQFLTYMAGRTTRVQLGSMVVVLPWHSPLRVAEEISVLDQMSGGRVIFGMGRGLGRIEFAGFGLDMGQSRGRFMEYAEAILGALETGEMAFEGTYLKQPRTGIRPRAHHSFQGRAYASAVSPASSEIMARLGVGLLIIAQKPWDKTIAELDTYRAIFRELQGRDAPKPLIVSFIACHEDEATAKEMLHKYIRGYSASALAHYEFHNEGLADINGYEYYGALARNIKKHGIDAFVNFLADLQIYGTPDQVFEKIIEHQKLADSGAVIGVFSYGGMPHALARHNMDLFAAEVLPRLRAYDAGAVIGARPNADRDAAAVAAE